MSIELNDVSCLLHLSIKGRLLDHNKINIDDTLEMMVDYLRANLGDAMRS